ncbi:hypothetical protein BTE28158_05512 [Burkholderia territorii]|nr:hypothetical protein BTE28158_05512 [Burkholderia territorii]
MEPGNAPATLALHREPYSDLPDYPTDAQGMRGTNDYFWSSSLCPRLLIDERAAPHLCRIRSTVRRCVCCRKRHAMRDSTGRYMTCAVRDARRYRRESHFLFQECIATTVGNMCRSLNTAKQSRKRRTNATCGASHEGVANRRFILEKCVVAHCGRSAHRPCETACRGAFDSIRMPGKRRIEMRGTRCSGACTADTGKLPDVRPQPPRNAIDSSVKIPTGSRVDQQCEVR